MKEYKWVWALVILALILLALFMFIPPSQGLTLKREDFAKAKLDITLGTKEPYNIEATNPYLLITATLLLIDPEPILNLNKVSYFRLDLDNVAEGSSFDYASDKKPAIVQKFTFEDFGKTDLTASSLVVKYGMIGRDTEQTWGSVDLNTDKLKNAFQNFKPGDPPVTVRVPILLSDREFDDDIVQLDLVNKFYKLTVNPIAIAPAYDVQQHEFNTTIEGNEDGTYKIKFLSCKGSGCSSEIINYTINRASFKTVLDDTNTAIPDVYYLFDNDNTSKPYFGYNRKIDRLSEQQLQNSINYLASTTYSIEDINATEDTKFYIKYEGQLDDSWMIRVQEIVPLLITSRNKITFEIKGPFVNLSTGKQQYFYIESPKLNNLFELGEEWSSLNSRPLSQSELLILKNVMNEIALTGEEITLNAYTPGDSFKACNVEYKTCQGSRTLSKFKLTTTID